MDKELLTINQLMNATVTVFEETICCDQIRKRFKVPFLNGITGTKTIDLLSCPKCGLGHKDLDHGQSARCECGLKVTKYGNSLHFKYAEIVIND